MNFSQVQVKRLERAGCTDVKVGAVAIRATLPTDEFDRKVAVQCAKENGWEVRGNNVFALLEESAAYLLSAYETLKAENEDGYYANNAALQAATAMMGVFGDKARADRDSSPLGFLDEMCA